MAGSARKSSRVGDERSLRGLRTSREMFCVFSHGKLNELATLPAKRIGAYSSLGIYNSGRIESIMLAIRPHYPVILTGTSENAIFEPEKVEDRDIGEIIVI